MAEPRIRRCVDRGEFERVIDDLAIQGYKILARSDETARLKKNDYGSVGVHIILLLLTVGIGNLIYALVKSGSADEVMVRLDPPIPTNPPAPSAIPDAYVQPEGAPPQAQQPVDSDHQPPAVPPAPSSQ